MFFPFSLFTLSKLANGRLDDEHKRMCEVSRIDGTRLLARALEGRKAQLDSFVGISAIGFYGWDPQGAVSRESDIAGTDWAALLCQKWEKEYEGIRAARKVVLRIPPVLSNDGGAFPKMRLPASLGAAATFGSGKQIFPWIHEADLSRAIERALFSDDWKGIVNVVAPESEQTSAQEFTAELCKR